MRTTEETARAPDRPPAGIAVAAVPLEDGLHGDAEFGGWESSGEFGTPLYYRRFLERWPDRCAAAVTAVANAAPGGVLVHCAKGCDRTGMVVALLLTLLDTPVEHIATDYAHTARRLRHTRAAALGRHDDSAEIAAVLTRAGSRTPEEALLHFLATTDVPGLLRTGGLTEEDVTALRTRAVT